MNRIFMKLLRLNLLLLLMGLTASARSAESPILRLDPGGHMAVINAVTFTPDGRFLVSAADDKVIRVWDVASGRTTRTLLGQIGGGGEGQVFAMALSPDGRWLAAGGFMATFTGDNHEDVGAVRLYDFASGELVALLKGHKDVVVSLAFSGDGRYLVSGSYDQQAILWSVNERRRLGEPLEHSDSVYSVAFSSDSKRVVTGGGDRLLYLWRVQDGKLQARLDGHAGEIRSIAVSEADGTIASSGADGAIRLWDGETGHVLQTLVQGEPGIGKLSFSPDGRYLLAGAVAEPYHSRVYRVSDGQKIVSYEGHDNSISAVVASPDGRLAATVGGRNQEIHLWFFEDGRFFGRLFGKGSSVLAVGFSEDGRDLAWGTTDRYQDDNNRGPLSYSLRLPDSETVLGFPKSVKLTQDFRRAQSRHGKWRLVTHQGDDGGYASVLEIQHGKKGVTAIKRDLTSGYVHRAYTFTPDGQTVISGGDNGTLSAYDLNGQKLGEFVGHTSEIWAVAVSPDGRFVASGSQDQTVRLWDAKSHNLLLTLFHFTSGREEEWVAWTPSGYYATSPKGDRYVGWHQNRGAANAAEYYPAARFAAQRYRPDLVSDAVLLKSEQLALDRWQQARPSESAESISDLIAQVPQAPRILKAPPRDVYESEQTLEVQVDERTERVVVSVNGRPATRGFDRVRKNAADKLHTETINLSPGFNQIEILARNRYGDSSVVALTVVYRREVAQWQKPNLYLVAIGVSEYADSSINLSYAHQDAQALVQRFEQEQGHLYGAVHTTLLTNDKATRDDILDALDSLKHMTQDDLAILFIAGHGKKDEHDNFYFLAHDTDHERLRRSGVRAEDFREIAGALPGKVMMLADACHSADIYGKQKTRAVPNLEQLAKEFAGAETGLIVFASSQGKEFSEESPDWKHGAFTKALLEGLSGGADFNKDDVVHQTELEAFVKRRVADLTDGRQHPITVRPDAIADFALSLVSPDNS